MVAVAARSDPTDDPRDAADLATRATALADAIERALPVWLVRMVGERWRAWCGEALPSELRARAEAAAAQARAEIVPELRALLGSDVDEQRSNPLALVRRAVGPATEVLAGAGMPHVVRDVHAERIFPDDVYDLSPASFGDLDASVHEPGIEWGAAKAHVVLARRRREARDRQP